MSLNRIVIRRAGTTEEKTGSNNAGKLTVRIKHG